MAETGRTPRKPGNRGSQRGRAKNDTAMPGAPPVVERVAHITRLMARGEWVTGVTARELAAEWGLAVNTVEQSSAEASRGLQLELEKQDLAAQLVATLQHNIAEAMKRGEGNVVNNGCKFLAEIAGVEAPKKLDVGGTLADILALGLGAGGSEPDPPVEG